MRVNREFKPDVAKRLETVDEEVLSGLLASAADEEVDFAPEDLTGIAQARRELQTGKGIPHERVAEWLDSWGSDNEQPAPR